MEICDTGSVTASRYVLNLYSNQVLAGYDARPNRAQSDWPRLVNSNLDSCTLIPVLCESIHRARYLSGAAKEGSSATGAPMR